MFFYALPKAWLWYEKVLGSIKNSNRLFQKSVRTRRNRRRLPDSDFCCVFDMNSRPKPWKHGIFGVLASAIIFRQIPPSSVLATWLEISCLAHTGPRVRIPLSCRRQVPQTSRVLYKCVTCFFARIKNISFSYSNTTKTKWLLRLFRLYFSVLKTINKTVAFW